MNDPDLEIVATKVAEMIWLKFQNRYATAPPFTSTPMSNTASTNRFFLSVGSEAPGPSSVCYYVNDEWMAAELCKLFESELGESSEQKISYFMIDSNDISQLLLHLESVDELAIYTDPDLGVYDATPSENVVRRARYYSRAQHWESKLESLLKQKAAASKNQSSSEQSDSKGIDSSSGGSASSKEPKNDTGSRATSASEQTLEDLLNEFPEEDCRNASYILLMWFAQDYHRMLEATTFHAEWLTAKDLNLNQSYIRTIQVLSNLLTENSYLSDFPEKFEPIFQDLYPSTIADVDWQWMVAPHADGFLATVQKYVLSKRTYDPKKDSPGWIILQMFLDEVQTAIENANNYDQSMRKERQRLFGSKTKSNSESANAKDETKPSSGKKTDETPPAESKSNTNLSFPESAKWSELSIRFLDAHNVQVTFRDQSQRFHFTQMNMADGRSNTKPAKQWFLLELFAKERGTITWNSKGSSDKWKKHKQKLCQTLRNLFEIIGDPIVYSNDDKGWNTVFEVRET